MPRRTPSPWVVFAWPPGIAVDGGGSGRALTLSSSSTTGAGQRIFAPVGIVPPSASALRRRSSTGSISSTAASLSICASCAKQVWTAPNPRIAPHGGLSV